jgi:hypothetical protein
MSHHLDSPLARRDSRLNITDQYVFGTADATVFVLNAGTSLAGNEDPSRFHPEGRYEIKVHLDGAAYEALTFRVTFAEADGGGQQAFVVERLDGAAATDDAATGEIVVRGRTGETALLPSGGRVWAGRAADPFYLDLSLLGDVDAVVQKGKDLPLAERRAQDTVNTFAGSTIQSIVFELPHTDDVLRPGRQVAVWSAAKLATDSGGWQQVNRQGVPMIWPIFRDAESDEASTANERVPADDQSAYGNVLTTLVSAAVARLGTVPDPAAHAAAVADRLLPDVLPYRLGTPALFDFATFNGRPLSANAPEVMFSLVLGAAVPTGLRMAQAAETRSAEFPYVVPHTG